MDSIPEWVYWVGTALGTTIGAMVLRLGLKSTVGDPPKKHDSSHYIDKVGVLVDSKAIELLSGSIEGHSMEMIAGRKAGVEQSEALVKSLTKLIDELSELREEVRQLGRTMREK